jgi:phage tail-like protein
MDANGTRLFTLLGEGDWSVCTDDQGISFSKAMEAGPEEYLESTVGLGWDAAHHEVILHPRLMKFKAAPRDIPPTIDDRRGAARDRYGNWYWIDPTETEILVNSAGTGTTSHFWSSADQASGAKPADPGEFQAKESSPTDAPQTYGGLAVTEDHFLIVGVLEPAGLLVFDLHAGGPPQQILWPESIEFEPFDMAAAPGGGVWILDRTNKRYWAIDRHLNVINYDQSSEQASPSDTEDFHAELSPVQAQTPKSFPTGIPLPIPSPLNASDPIAIEALPDGTVLILDTNFSLGSSTVSRYRFSEQLGDTVLLDEFEFAGYDLAFVPEHSSTEGTVPDRLYMASTEGNQTYAFGISLNEDGTLILTLVNEYYPMRLFEGKALVASGTKVYYDFGTGWIPLIRQLRPQYTIEGTLQTPIGDGRPPFDGREPDCVWHRLMLDACIPADTEVEVWSRAANDVSQLQIAEWLEEPSLLLRGDGSELPFVPPQTGTDAGTWELLFQRAVGRYLQLRLVFRGNGRSTPRVRVLRVYAPRFSYLGRYLPAVYREDETSASFLDRFLANFEGTLTADEDKIAAVQVLFDPRSAPAEALEWLASWLGAVLDPKWDDLRRRLFIKHAMTFFQYRGTIWGLSLALHLALDDCIDESLFDGPPPEENPTGAIRIIEKFRTRKSPGVLLGDPTDLTGIRSATPAQQWDPSQGRNLLIQEYRDATGASESEPFPLRSTATEWKQFVLDRLGFVPSTASSDEKLWQEFLTRRYHRPSAFNKAHALTQDNAMSSFADATLPDELPRDGAPLKDWYEFQTIVVAMQRLAHRFTALIPFSRADAQNPDTQLQRFQLAQRIIQLEKPAHTIFEVKFYWALFRVGMVRLGSDTILDVGSRSSYLLAPMVLGQGYLLESYLAPRHPQNVGDRTILGRDRLKT